MKIRKKIIVITFWPLSHLVRHTTDFGLWRHILYCLNTMQIAKQVKPLNWNLAVESDDVYLLLLPKPLYHQMPLVPASRNNVPVTD